MVSRVDAKVVEPEEGVALALEDVGDPAEGVVKVPQGDADAGGVLDAGSDGLDPSYCQPRSDRLEGGDGDGGKKGRLVGNQVGYGS